jgi:hypothetical protein
MGAAFLLRVGSLVFHSVMGGMAVFCLICAAILPDAGWLMIQALKWFGLAFAVAYCQDRYVDK